MNGEDCDVSLPIYPCNNIGLVSGYEKITEVLPPPGIPYVAGVKIAVS